MTDLPRGRTPRARLAEATRPPVPDLPSRGRYIRHGSIDTTSSVSSSSNSSRLSEDRPSSITSFEDEDESYQEDEPKKLAPGFGSSLWSRVAAAAGGLTVSVSKAWETGVVAASGESACYEHYIAAL